MRDSRPGYRVIKSLDRDIPILFTNKALANAEKIMKKGIVGVLSGFQEGESGISEVAVLLQAGINEARRVERIGGGRVSVNAAYKILDDLGFSRVAADVFEAISEVLARDTGSDDDEFEDLDDDEKN